jgi:hypothetical protein
MIRLPFYPFIEYRTKQVMFEIEGKIYKDRVNLHLVYDKEHVPDFYLAIFDEKGLYLERGVGRYLGDVHLDLDEDNARSLKIVGVDLI